MTTLTRTARLTGLAYLGLAVCGLLGFLLVRQQIYVPGDAAATAANLVGQEGLARLGIAADLTVVLSQALAAVGFFALFRRVDAVAAGAVAAFGLVNAVIILVATTFSATALTVALADDGTHGDPASTALLLHELTGTAWSVGGLFFGLWLIPMGWLTARSGSMPRPLGWVLVAGGVGYVLSTYLTHVAPDLAGASSVLVVPATVGEVWMVGYLLWKGAGPGLAARLEDATTEPAASVLTEGR